VLRSGTRDHPQEDLRALPRWCVMIEKLVKQYSIKSEIEARLFGREALFEKIPGRALGIGPNYSI
jgi:hypothetical protein